MRRLLHDLEIVMDGQGHIARVTGSIGIAWSRAAGQNREMLLRQADVALYAAKRTQKGTAQTYRVDADQGGMFSHEGVENVRALA